MATPRHLNNAPLTEAILDVRVKTNEKFSIEFFQPLRARFANTFPIVEEQRIFEGEVQLGPGKSVAQFAKMGEVNGLLFKSSDGLNIAQFRRDGFTFNRLHPYTSWEDVFPQAWDLWSRYIETSAAEFVTRIALRYINLLTLPTPVRDLGDYLTAPPRTPEGVEGSIASFLTRVVVNIPQNGLAAIITQALEKPAEPGSVRVILDIDAYKQEELDLTDASIREVFHDLRDLKNKIFFNSITEDAARLFE